MDTSATAAAGAAGTGTSAIAQLDQEFLAMGHPMEIDLSGGAFDDDTYMANGYLFGGFNGSNGSGSNGAAGLMPQHPFVKE
jgi:hypothetical protein